MKYRIREQIDVFNDCTLFHVERGGWFWWDTISGGGYRTIKEANDRIEYERARDARYSESEKSIRYHQPPPRK